MAPTPAWRHHETGLCCLVSFYIAVFQNWPLAICTCVTLHALASLPRPLAPRTLRDLQGLALYISYTTRHGKATLPQARAPLPWTHARGLCGAGILHPGQNRCGGGFRGQAVASSPERGLSDAATKSSRPLGRPGLCRTPRKGKWTSGHLCRSNEQSPLTLTRSWRWAQARALLHRRERAGGSAGAPGFRTI